ncbi:MAG: PTS sugar transporter subunit IIA, partial [Fusobacteriaceae bacterium]|nr:PTS sugar transporter subunit IIA [Fusobacteriaceae bacterium]
YVEKEYFESMLEREKISSTYLDYGIAIPHCTKEGRKFIKNYGVAVLQYPYGIDYGNGKKVYLLIAIASLEDRHMEILNKLAEIFDDEKTAEELSTTSSIDNIYNCLLSLEDKNA